MSKIIRSLRTLLLFGLDSVCQIFPRSQRDLSLVLRLDAIGDFFIWMQSGAVDIAAAAREEGRRSVLVANVAWAEYARGTGLWDRVIPFYPTRFMRNPFHRLRFLMRIRRLGAALLIQPRHARVFLQEDAIARASGARHRVGSAGTFINLPRWLHAWGNRYYHTLLSVDESAGVHETTRNGNFILDLRGHGPTRYAFSCASPAERVGVIVAIGAGQAGRVWPIENLARVLSTLKDRQPKMDMVLVGSRAEAKRAAALEAHVGAGLVNRVGKTKLDELIKLIASAHLVICNDTSAYHIAMAVGTKVVCFLGGGHFGWYAPYPLSASPTPRARVLHVPMECYWCNWQCKYPRSRAGAFRCVAQIPVKVALEAVNDLLPTDE